MESVRCMGVCNYAAVAAARHARANNQNRIIEVIAGFIFA